MKVVLLCGGLGTRLKEETEFKPKPMVEIAGRPILWHIMKSYSQYGFNKFILCLGYKGDIIKDYFYNYEIQNNDFTLTLGNGKIQIHNQHSEAGWEITFAETGLNSMTGARVKKIQKYMDDEIFMLTYGDGLCDININELIEFHKASGKIATITGVLPPSRFGELLTKNNLVKSFNEKPQIHSGGYINGGFFVFNKKIFDYIPDDDNCILERQPLEDLVKDQQLCVFEHKGFWQCMDTYRDFELLNKMWNEGKASWKKWK
ncbi:MAG: glucose-1-phosphate cytidylyltransferase [bacterium]